MRTTYRGVFLSRIDACPEPYLLPEGGRVVDAPLPELVEGGKLKLVLLAYVAFEGIDLC